LRDRAQVVRVIKKLVFDCDVNLEEVNAIIHFSPFVSYGGRVWLRFLHREKINQDEGREIKRLAVGIYMCGVG
jgi:hypothetical protein